MKKEFDYEPMQKRHEIVTLVGSTAPEWYSMYRHVARELTIAGYVVISVGVFKNDIKDLEEYRELLESIHFQKIDMADKIVLIDQKAVGKHTRIELEYAQRRKKPLFVFDESSRDLKPIRFDMFGSSPVLITSNTAS